MGEKNILKLIPVFLALTLLAYPGYAFGIEFFAPRTQSVELNEGEVTSFRIYGTPESEHAQVSYAWFLDEEQVSTDPYYVYDSDTPAEHTLRVVILEETDPPKEYHSHWDITVNGKSGGISRGTQEGGKEYECIGVWLCTLWTECQEDGTSTRECEEIRCQKTEGGPSTLRECEYIPPPEPEQPEPEQPEEEQQIQEPKEQEVINDIAEPDESVQKEQAANEESEIDDLSGITGGVVKETNEGDKGLSLGGFITLTVALFVIAMIIIFGARSMQAKRKGDQNPNRSRPTFLQ